MVKIVVNKGRRVWDRENHRDAKEGEIVEVKPIEATILKYRGAASDAPAEPAPKPAPAPPIPTPLPPPPPQPAAEASAPETPPRRPARSDPFAEEAARRPYRRRDLQPEE